MTMTEQSAEIWLFHPKANADSYKPVARLIQDACESENWRFHVRHIHGERAPQGRPLKKILNEDATNLYKRLHRARVGVWQIGDALAPTTPQPRHARKDYVSLADFVRHKAFHARLPRDGFAESWRESLVGFQEWLSAIGCENEADPRCLPFHVFDTRFNIDRLASAEGRSDFAAAHGWQSSRVDDRGLTWSRGQRHGRETLNVAGRELARGFHWDVSPNLSNASLSNSSETWRVSRRGYVNAYPDGYIRDGNGARRIYPPRKKKTRQNPAGFASSS